MEADRVPAPVDLETTMQITERPLDLDHIISSLRQRAGITDTLLHIAADVIEANRDVIAEQDHWIESISK